jgi:hypothetical protein
MAALLASVSLAGCSLFQHGPAEAVGGAPTSALSAVTPTGTASVQPSASVSSSTPGASAPVPPTITGYALSPASATVVRTFQSVAGKLNGVYTGLTVRNVSKGSNLTGVLVLLGLQPGLVGNTTVERGLLPGMIKGMSGQGVKTSTQKIGDLDVAVGATKTTSMVGWYKSGVVVLVLGNGVDPAPTLTFAKAYLAAH